MRQHCLPLLLALLIPFAATAQEKTPDEKFLRPGTESSTDSSAPVAPDDSGPTQPPFQAPVRSPDDSLRFGLGISYFNSDKVTFEDVDVSALFGSGVRTDLDLKVERAVAISFSIQHLPKYRWGFLGVANFESRREITDTKLSNAALAYNAKEDKLTLLTLDGNLAYRWDQLYIPFGLNVSAVSYKADGSGAAMKPRGGLGLQFGLGAMITPNISAEVMVKTISFGFEQTYNNSTVEYKNGTMSGLLLSIRYVF